MLRLVILKLSNRCSKKKIEVVQHEAFRLKKIHSTLDAKAMIIKMKFMPMLSFLSKVYCFPCNLFTTLNNAILRHFIGFNKSITMNEITKNRKEHLCFYGVGQLVIQNCE